MRQRPGRAEAPELGYLACFVKSLEIDGEIWIVDLDSKAAVVAESGHRLQGRTPLFDCPKGRDRRRDTLRDGRSHQPGCRQPWQ
jgi:hypothetical protein